MPHSFSINSKPQPNRRKKPSAAADESPAIKFVSEFRSDEAPPSESQIKAIAPIPNKKLKNLLQLFKPNGEDAGIQFELDSGSNPEPGDTSTGYGLNLRQPSANGSDVPESDGNHETTSDVALRKLREDLRNLPEGPTLDQFEDVPVECFAAALLSGLGWKEGRGIGRNAKGDVKVADFTKRRFRGGFGFREEMPEPENRKKMKVQKEEKEVMIVNGREKGMKGKIFEVRNGSKSHGKVKVKRSEVVEVGSAEEEKFIERRNLASKSGHERVDARRERGRERVNWLRNHIRVKIISQELKRGRLYLKKGVVVDVVGPGVCDVWIDETGELVQGVDQDFLETALPKLGGPVLVLCGRHKGVYGNLLERNMEKETGVVRDADSHELLGVKLEQVAEYRGDPSDIDY